MCLSTACDEASGCLGAVIGASIWVVIAPALAGFIAALTGLGGGVVMVPALSILAGLDIGDAIGLSLAAIAVNASISGARYIEQGLVYYDRVAIYASLSIPGAYIGGFVATRVSPRLLEAAFAVFLFYVSITIIRKRDSSITQQETIEGGVNRAYSSAAALGAGFLSGLLGIGGGTVIMPLLTLAERMDIKRAVATSTVIVAITASSGFAAHALYVPYGFVGLVALSAAVGSFIGSLIMIGVKRSYLRLLLAATLLLAAVRMFLRAMGG